jgi:hypothetical protein
VDQLNLSQTITASSVELAQRSTTPPDQLQELAKSAQQDVRQGVVSNPNTPAAVLLKLGEEFPAQLLSNPILPFLLLENPRLVEDIPPSTLQNLLKQNNVPASFLEYAVDSPYLGIRLAVAMNPKTSKVQLERLQQRSRDKGAATARLHINWAGEITSGWDEAAREAMQNLTPTLHDGAFLEELVQIQAIPEFVVQRLIQQAHYNTTLGVIAASPHTASEVLRQLSNHPNRNVQDAVATNPNTPADILEEWGEGRDQFILQLVLQNPSTPIAVLTGWAEQKHHKSVYRAIACNPSTPLDVLHQWTRQLDWQTALGLTKAPDLPGRTLELLAYHAHVAVQLGVAEHTNTPIAWLEQWAFDIDARFRAAVAGNPTLPGQILIDHLMKDTDPLVRAAVAKRVSMREPAIATQLIDRINQQPEPYEQRLAQLATHPEADIRQFVAALPDVLPSILDQLATDTDLKVRQAVAQHPSTSEAALMDLVCDAYEPVSEAAARNRNLSFTYLWQQVLQSGLFQQALADRVVRFTPTGCSAIPAITFDRCLTEAPELLPTVLEHYAQGSLPDFSRLLLLLHSQTPTGTLATYQQSLSWLERYAIAQHGNTSVSILDTLAKDGNRIVRATAIANLRRSQTA